MALSLNTSHPLYSYLAALFCVDDDGVVKDLTGSQTCTTDASVVIGSGTYGRHFRTTIVSNNALGVALSPGIVAKPLANPVGTTFVVINAGNSRVNRGSVFSQPSTNTTGPSVYTGDAVGIGVGSAYPDTLGTTDVIGTGAHSFAVGYNGVTGSLGAKTAVDGAVENSTTTNKGSANDTNKHTYIGGAVTGGYGGFAADYVWIAHFNRYLTDTEISDLHASLAADNAFSLVSSSGAVDATAPGATLTGTSTLTPGTATAASAGVFVTDISINNTGSVMASTFVNWRWNQGEPFVAPTSVTYGTGTTDADGRLAVTGLPTGFGWLLYATPDRASMCYEEGTVT